MPKKLEDLMFERTIVPPKPEHEGPTVKLPETPIKDQGTIDRFLAGFVEGTGASSENTEGAGLPGLAGYGVGTAATGGLGLAAKLKGLLLAGVIPPKAVRAVAAKTARGIEHPQVRETFEWIKDHVAPTQAGHVTRVKVGPAQGAYAAANSEFEQRVAELGNMYFRQTRAKDPLSRMTEKQAHDYVREQLIKNLSPKRVDNLSKLTVVTVDPSAHRDYFDLLNSMGHETVGHGRQIRTMGKELQPEYSAWEELVDMARMRTKPNMRPDPNPLEESGLRVGDRIERMFRNWYRQQKKSTP